MTTDDDRDAALVETPPPITREEVRRLLGLVMLRDGRHNPGDATIAEWLGTALRERWTLPEAEAAVRSHYDRRTEFLMPGHITAGIRAQREHRRQPAQWRQRSRLPAASDETRAGAMASIRRTFAEARQRRQATTPEEDTTSA